MSTHAVPVVARIVADDLGPISMHRPIKAPFQQRLARRLSTALVAIFIAFIATMGVGGGSQPANAVLGIGNPVDSVVNKMKDLFCFGTVEGAPAPLSSMPGDTTLMGARAPWSGSLTNRSVTAYEEYGSAGLFWSEYRPKTATDNADGQAGCITNKFGSFIGNLIANNVFSTTRMISGMTVGIYTWATGSDLLSSFDKPLTCVINGCDGGKGLKQTLFLDYLAPIVMLGALWGAWNGLIKKRTTETAQGGLWMVCATAFALIFMANPGLVAFTANKFVGDMTSTLTNSIAGATSSTVGSDDMCWLADGSPNRGSRMAACTMYKAMLVTPWAAGQFGVPMTAPLNGDKAVKIGNRSSKDLRVAQIEAQTVSQDEIASGDSYDTIKSKDAEVWDSVRTKVKAGAGTGTNKASYITWTGDQYGERVNIAFASVVASVCLGILVVLISFSSVVMAVGMILLIMMAPVFLLVGIHPGFGRGIALKWLELLIGTVVKRIVLASVLAVLVGMYQIILQTPMPWLSQIGLIMAIGVGAIIFRKPLLETFNVINLGGSRTGLESGLDRAGKRGASAATGAAGGAVGSAAAGGGLGSIVGGAAKGGVMGSRSGSPVRAATMGSATGRRIGARDASERESEQQQADKAKAKTQKALQNRIDRDPYDPEAWAELEKWNKKNKKHQVVPPGSGGSTPYPQSEREARQMDQERQERQRNGGSGSGSDGSGPRPQTPAPQGPAPQTPAPQGPAPQTPAPQGPAPRGGGIPVTPPNGENPASPPSPNSNGLPISPPAAPASSNGQSGSGNRTSNPPRPRE